MILAAQRMLFEREALEVPAEEEGEEQLGLRQRRMDSVCSMKEKKQSWQRAKLRFEVGGKDSCCLDSSLPSRSRCRSKEEEERV
jgi:hypothetical protein